MWQLIVTTLVRLVVNTAFRLFYPFVPELSRAFAVPAEALTAAVSARGAVGLVSPLIGAAADRIDRRTLMLLGLAVVSGALGLIGVAPSLTMIGFGAALMAVGKLAYDLGVLAHIGDQTPYAQRGRVIGLSETSWSGAALIGLPLVGLVIGRFGAQAPFLILAGLVALSLIAIAGVVRASPAGTRRGVASQLPRPTLRTLLSRPGVAPILLTSLLIPLANEVLNAIYGLWLEGSFGLSVESIGASAVVFGMAELAGEGCIALFADRLGKRNLAIVGALLGVAAYLALPMLSATGRIELALLGVGGVYLGFEILVVGSIPIVSELAPEARATILSTSGAMQSAGRLFGAWAGLALFPFGIWPAALFAAGLNLTISAILWRWARA